MKYSMLPVTVLAVCTLPAVDSRAQSSLSVSVPVIWSDVTVKDNWTPPTAVAYKEHRSGSALGYGASLNYSFKQGFLIKNRNFQLHAGIGYFRQKFDITRPFNYSSPIYIIFYTDYYTYHCLQVSAGLTYNYPLNDNFSLVSRLACNWLHSVRQTYSPSRKDFPAEVRRSQRDFGNMLTVSIGGQQRIRERLLFELSILAPVYTRWRGDRIFDDDPTTFSHPEFSLGASIGVTYVFNRQERQEGAAATPR